MYKKIKKIIKKILSKSTLILLIGNIFAAITFVIGTLMMWYNVSAIAFKIFIVMEVLILLDLSILNTFDIEDIDNIEENIYFR